MELFQEADQESGEILFFNVCAAHGRISLAGFGALDFPVLIPIFLLIFLSYSSHLFKLEHLFELRERKCVDFQAVYQL